MTLSVRNVADAFPELEAFFCGYLHQDYPEAYGDASGAILPGAPSFAWARELWLPFAAT